MPLASSSGPLVWIDCEMTGLDCDADTILSLCCFVTSPQLEMLDDVGYEAVIHHDKKTLARMNEWCTIQHGSSGLTERCITSTTTAEDAAHGLLEYIKRFVKEPQVGLLAGNTVHADKAFLRHPPYKPVINHLHHRIFDVSAIKEAARRWATEEQRRGVPDKKNLHDARQDILESIEEARYYQKTFFSGGA